MPRIVTNHATILQSLERLGIEHRVDDVAPSIASIDPGRGVTVVTSRRAIRAYDEKHPERIVCLVVKASSFIVIVNNRELVDVDARISTFWNMDQRAALEDNPSCGICYATPTRRRPLTLSACPHCTFLTCVACLEKMAAFDEDASKCPHCRQWKLDGDAFGTPLDVHRTTLEESREESRADPIDTFMSIVSALDGEVLVLPMVDNILRMSTHLVTCRLGGTDRISRQDAYVSHGRLRKAIRHLWGLHSSSWSFCMYTVRPTFRIDAETDRVVEEVSLFQITPDGRLLQLEAESWKLDALLDMRGYVHRVQVAHIKEHTFEMPEAVRDLLLKIQSDLGEPMKKTVSFASAKVSSANFDVDEAGTITTMSRGMAARYSWMALQKLGEAGLDVCVRLFAHEDSEKADLVTYRVRLSGSIERLSPLESRRIFNRDLDGLKRSKRIVNFL